MPGGRIKEESHGMGQRLCGQGGARGDGQRPCGARRSYGIWQRSLRGKEETAVGIACSYNLGTTVVTVLTHFCNHDTGLTTLAFREFLSLFLSFEEVGIIFVSLEYTPEIVLITAL